MRTQRKVRWSALLLAVLLAPCLDAGLLGATEYFWQPTTGQWLNPTAWSPPGPPMSLDVAYVTNGGTATIFAPVPYTVTAGTLYIYDPSGTSKVVQDGADAVFGQILAGLPDGNGGTYELRSDNNLEILGNASIGNVGTGFFTQTAGTTTIDVDLRLGSLPLGHGTCTLSNGSLSVGGLAIIGDQGTGTFVEERGTVTVMGTLAIGSQAGSHGSYTLSDGLLDVRGNALIGHSGTGSFTQDGGTCRVAASAVFILGNAVGSEGTYTLTSGALEAGTMYVGGSGGGGGRGFFDQRGGTVTANALQIGSGTASGTYRMGDACVLTIAGGINVGAAGRLEWFGGTLDTPLVALTPGATVALGNDCDVAERLLGGPVVFNGLGGACLQMTNGASGTQSNRTLGVARLDVGVAGGGGGGGGGGRYTLAGTGYLQTAVLNVGGAEANSFFDWYDPESSLDAPRVNILTNGYMNVFRNWEYGGALDIQGGTLDIKTNVLTIGGESGTANVNGSLIGDTVRIDYGRFTQSGGHSCVAAFLNGWAEGGGGGSGGIVVTGGILEATFIGNGGTFEEEEGRVVAGTFDNQEGGMVDLSGGTLEADTYYNRGYGGLPTAMAQAGAGHTTYVRGHASVEVDNIINDGEYRLTKAGTIRGKTSIQGTFDNRGSFYMDAAVDDPKGGHGEPMGGTFEDRLINRGYFEYTIGNFKGALEHWASADGFYYVGNFTAGRGIYNYGEMWANPFSRLTGNGTDGIVNYGILRLPDATLAGTKVVNDYGGIMYAKGTIATAFENNGVLELEGVLTVTGASTNRGSIAAESLERFVAQGALSNSGLIELRPAAGMAGGGVLAGPGQVTNETGGAIRMIGGGSVTAPLVNDGILEARDSQNLVITSLLSSQGEIRATNCRLNIQSAFTNSGAVVLENATVAGGTITNRGTIVGRGSPYYESMTNTVSSAVTNQGVIRCEALDLGGYYAYVMLTNLVFTAPGCTNAAGARIEAPDGTTIVFNQGLVANWGAILLAGGTFDNNNRALANSGAITGHGTFRTGGLTNTAGHNLGVGSGDMDVYGTFVNAAGATVTTQAGCTTTFYNSVSGGGQFPGPGTVVFLDGFSPGGSPAEVAFGGDMVLGGSAGLLMELGGTTPGAQYDKLDVGGTLSLGGALDVALIYGFQPEAGQTFHLFDWGTLDGTFDTVAIPALGGGLAWDTTNLYTTGALTVVPEPATLGFVAFGVAGVILRSRRQRRDSSLRS